MGTEDLDLPAARRGRDLGRHALLLLSRPAATRNPQHLHSGQPGCPQAPIPLAQPALSRAYEVGGREARGVVRTNGPGRYGLVAVNAGEVLSADALTQKNPSSTRGEGLG